MMPGTAPIPYKQEEAPPPRRDWLGHGLQTLATIIFIALAALAWGDRIEGQIADQRVSLSGLSARVDALEAERRAENEARRQADAALALAAALAACGKPPAPAAPPHAMPAPSAPPVIVKPPQVVVAPAVPHISRRELRQAAERLRDQVEALRRQVDALRDGVHHRHDVR